MDAIAVEAAARSIIASVECCCAAGLGADGEVEARILLTTRPTDDWQVCFLTLRHSRKVTALRRSSRMTLAWHDVLRRAYAVLAGSTTVTDQVAAKRAIWQPRHDRLLPGGPADPGIVLVQLVADRIEVYDPDRGILPPPAYFNAAVLTRGGPGWRLSTSSPG
jgi:general stress protein 26